MGATLAASLPSTWATGRLTSATSPRADLSRRVNDAGLRFLKRHMKTNIFGSRLHFPAPLYNNRSVESTGSAAPRLPYVPLVHLSAVARSGGPGRPPGRRVSALPWTAASTMAGLVVLGRTASLAIAILLVLAPLDYPAIAGPLARIAPPQLTLSTNPFADLIAEAAQRCGIPAIWIRAVMRAESGGDVRAASRKGAMGLMQIMPETWMELRLRHHLGVDPYDPRDNIMAGAAYLREMLDRYGSPSFLAAYNAGPARYEEHRSTGRALPAETRAYVAALAPMIEATQIGGPIMIADSAPDSPPWASSSLFVTRVTTVDIRPSESNATADRPSSKLQSKRTPIPNPVVDVSAIIPQSEGLFVRRAWADRLP